MKTYSFFALIHLDRFADLALVIGDHDVFVDPYSVGSDGTAEVYFSGGAEVAIRLETCIRRISDILTSPALEWV